VLVCDMRWEDVGSTGEESNLGGDQSTREVTNSASYGGGMFGDVLFLQHIIPTCSPCMGREIEVATRGVKNELCRQGRKQHTVPFALQEKLVRGCVAARLSRILTHPTKKSHLYGSWIETEWSSP